MLLVAWDHCRRHHRHHTVGLLGKLVLLAVAVYRSVLVGVKPESLCTGIPLAFAAPVFVILAVILVLLLDCLRVRANVSVY